MDIPLLAQEADVELVLLQLFAGERHDLVEGPLQEMVPPYQQPREDQGPHVLRLAWISYKNFADAKIWKAAAHK